MIAAAAAQRTRIADLFLRLIRPLSLDAPVACKAHFPIIPATLPQAHICTWPNIKQSLSFSRLADIHKRQHTSLWLRLRLASDPEKGRKVCSIGLPSCDPGGGQPSRLRALR